ncbi:MAG: HAMP domain-containing histidine kinase [Candidatus Aminicenantes bacterium]|nr:MAG: HAMP domain-containing histidine kinase [Candidatus Aminicenantes bacterium]
MFKTKLKQHGHHVIFSMSIISLALLVTWWSVFINRSIEERRTFHMKNLKLTLNFFSLQLGTAKDYPVKPGVFSTDERFEVATCPPGRESFAKPLLPLWPGLCLKVRKNTLTTIEKDFKRKKMMVIGESGLLFLIILLSSVLLYQFIRLEKRSTREVEEFWGRVTHEIKTPITGLKAFLQSLKNESLSPDKLSPFVDMALIQVEKQEQLADNILAGYQMQSGNNEHQPQIKDLNLNECVKEYFDRHVIRLTDAKLSLHLETGGNSMVRADCHILRVILDNIVDNALKYCSPGLMLTVNVFTEKKRAVIAIKDNGPGFPPGFSEKIFAAYKYLKGELPGIKHGSGMGLYISRKLAEQMGGRLEAASKGEGKGAEFRLLLNRSKT